MLRFVDGNLFDTDATIRINTVNCVGVMGKGVALQFKDRYPEMFEEYRAACEVGEIQPGKLHVWRAPNGETVVNFPTKRHWKEKSRYEDIDSGLEALHEYLEPLGNVKVALPALGCGHGGLDWTKVSEKIKKALGDLKAEIFVFKPSSSRRNPKFDNDPRWREIAAKLQEHEIRILDPDDSDVPSGLRDLFPDRVYWSGDLRILHRPIVGLITSDDPSERETQAAIGCAVEISNAGCAIGAVVSNRCSANLIQEIASKGCQVVVVPSTGILDAEEQGLLSELRHSHSGVVSVEQPERSRTPSYRDLPVSTLWAISKSVLVTSPEGNRISLSVGSVSRKTLRPVFAVDYGSKRTGVIASLKPGRITRSQSTGRPNVDQLLNAVGVAREVTAKETNGIIIPAESRREKPTQPQSVSDTELSSQQQYPKRLIEVDLPIARISAHARREKSIRHGHISTLHIWWARRPLAACRAVMCAALWPDPADPNCPRAFIEAAATHLTAFAKRVNPEMITEEKHRLQATVSHESRGRWEALAAGTLTLDIDDPSTGFMLQLCLLDFIADFTNWDSSTVPAYLETSRALTQAAHEALGGAPGTRPLVVDPFAGGGSIPLEALRVGADAFASDLNPVPVLLNKVVLEYIPKYGSRLADEVRKWGQWIKQEAEKELTQFFPKDSDGASPIAYLWARTIRCEGPGCGAEVPLMRTLWLAKKASRGIALHIVSNADEKRIEFRIIVKRGDEWGDQSNPDVTIANPTFEGTVKRGSATCPCCGYTTPVASVRAQLKARRGGAHDARLLAVVSTRPNATGRFFRLPMDTDIDAVRNAADELSRRQRAALHESTQAALSLVPDEKISPNELRRISIPIYGMECWGDLFTPRQALSLSVLARLVRQACRDEGETDFANAVRACLSLNFGRVADLSNALCGWKLDVQCPTHLFARQAIGMVWDFSESVCLSESSGSWSVMVDRLSSVLLDLGSDWAIGNVSQASATAQTLPDDSVVAIVTDPPYYDAVPYAYLSDFFYVWLRRMLADSLPDLFREEVVPKDAEIVVDRPHQLSQSKKDIAFYERELQRAFAESRRVLRPDGIGTIVFASKTTSSWEAILKAVVDAGWVITGSWPIDTEMETRVAAQGQARLASSVHLVCRPRENTDGSVIESVGEWRDILGELPTRIHEWMPRLTAEGVIGADAIFACLGPALEIFSRYSRVEKANGEPATLREYLEFVWAAVSTEALALIFKDADASGLEPDARLTAMWLWTIGGGIASGNGNGKPTDSDDEDVEPDTDDEEESSASGSKAKAIGGFTLEFDAARKIAQGLGVHLEQCTSLVEVKSDKARLLPVAERTAHLFGKGTEAATAGKGRKKVIKQRSLFEELDEAEAAEAGWSEIKGPPPGSTVLDRVHQAMILFAANRGELLKRFLVEDGVGKDARFWKLADNLNKLYPPGTEERRWIEGVLARKKGLGL